MRDIEENHLANLMIRIKEESKAQQSTQSFLNKKHQVRTTLVYIRYLKELILAEEH